VKNIGKFRAKFINTLRVKIKVKLSSSIQVKTPVQIQGQDIVSN